MVVLLPATTFPGGIQRRVTPTPKASGTRNPKGNTVGFVFLILLNEFKYDSSSRQRVHFSAILSPSKRMLDIW